MFPVLAIGAFAAFGAVAGVALATGIGLGLEVWADPDAAWSADFTLWALRGLLGGAVVGAFVGIGALVREYEMDPWAGLDEEDYRDE